MIKRLRKVGNSNALILDRAVMELVGLREDGAVQLTVRNGSLILTPADPNQVDPDRFEQSLARVMAKRRSALRRLAE
jgi:antitoxin component of MazEF toxin-antitoxin module